MLPGMNGAATEPRSAFDEIGRTIRIRLGGREFVLPVHPRRRMREWRESLDARFAVALGELRTANDPRAMQIVAAMPDDLLDALVAYDPEQTVLPDRDGIDALATEIEIFDAVLEVWQAANPFLARVLAAVSAPTPETPNADSGGPLSTSAKRTRTRSRTSKKH